MNDTHTNYSEAERQQAEAGDTPTPRTDVAIYQKSQADLWLTYRFASLDVAA